MRRQEKRNPKPEDKVFSSRFPHFPFCSSTRAAHRIILATLVGLFLAGFAAKGEQGDAAAQPGKGARRTSVSSQTAKGSHSFWDRENTLLFAGVGAGRALDYASTRHFRSRGVNEWLLSNQIVDNKPLFAGLEAAGVAASIGVSYLFHRSGHHKLERWSSVVHIGAGVGGSAWNYTLKASTPPRAAP